MSVLVTSHGHFDAYPDCLILSYSEFCHNNFSIGQKVIGVHLDPHLSLSTFLSHTHFRADRLLGALLQCTDFPSCKKEDINPQMVLTKGY